MTDSLQNNSVALQTRALSIGYSLNRKKDVCLHSNMDLELYRGDLICLVGPNGSGKTTLIRTMAGIQRPLAGEIFLNSKPLSHISQVEKSNLLSVVLTEKTTVGNMLVKEIVALGRYAQTNWLGTLSDADREAIANALQQVGMTELSGRTYGTLSDGEKQRTAIARALATHAPVLILDEPTAHLDIPNRVEIMSLLRNLTRQNNQAVLISTHDLDLALQVADEIWVIHPEKGLKRGIPEEMFNSGAIDEYFGGSSYEFIEHTGAIRLRINQIGKISVTGSGIKYQQLLAALKRMGIETEKVAHRNLQIQVTDKGFQLVSGKDATTYSGLIDLLRIIKHLLISDPDRGNGKNK